MRTELDIQTLQKAKNNAVAFYHANDSDKDFWEQCVDDIDDEIIAISKQKDVPMFTKARIGVMLAIALILVTIWLSGCQTASGLGRDITSISDGFMEQNSK